MSWWEDLLHQWSVEMAIAAVVLFFGWIVESIIIHREREADARDDTDKDTKETH